MLLRDAVTVALSTIPLGSVVSATVLEVRSDGLLRVDLGGGRVIDECYRADAYSAQVGDVAQVIRRDQASWLALCRTATVGPASVRVTASLSFPFNVSPPAPSGGVASPLVVSAPDARSYRENDGWSMAYASLPGAPMQGTYSNPGYGYYRGCYFYGAGAFSALAGARAVAGATIRISRHTAGGIASAENVWLAPHAHATRPSGAPLFVDKPRYIGALAWGMSGTFGLPLDWVQGLIRGTIKGFGHVFMGTADYSIYRPLSADAASGCLSIPWMAT